MSRPPPAEGSWRIPAHEQQVKTGIGNDEVACFRTCALGLDFGFPHGGKSALTGAAIEVGRILPLSSGHGGIL
jgi:hypothetical protein